MVAGSAANGTNGGYQWCASSQRLSLALSGMAWVAWQFDDVPFWGWGLGLLPASIILNHALYLWLVRAQAIRPDAESDESKAEHKRLLKARAIVTSDIKNYFGGVPLAIRFGIPIVLNAVVGLMLVHVLWHLPQYLGSMPVTHKGVMAGALGAYLYCVFQLGQRNLQHDITSGFGIWCAVQLAVGSVLGGAIFTVWTGKSPVESTDSLVVPFLAGFSLRLVTSAARGAAQRLWGGGNVATVRTLPLTALRGIDGAIADRLNEEGIYDVYGLAMSDPVRLLRNTAFDKRQIASWIDEALLMSFLPKSWEDLENNSITGAIDLAWEWAQYDEEREPAAKSQKQTTLQELAKRANISTDVLIDLTERLYEDAQVVRIWALYNDGRSNGNGEESDGENGNALIGSSRGSSSADLGKEPEDETSGKPKGGGSNGGNNLSEVGAGPAA